VRLAIGLIFLGIILSFAFYELAYGGGSKEQGRDGPETGAAGNSFPYW